MRFHLFNHSCSHGVVYNNNSNNVDGTHREEEDEGDEEESAEKEGTTMPMITRSMSARMMCKNLVSLMGGAKKTSIPYAVAVRRTKAPSFSERHDGGTNVLLRPIMTRGTTTSCCANNMKRSRRTTTATTSSSSPSSDGDFSSDDNNNTYVSGGADGGTAFVLLDTAIGGDIPPQSFKLAMRRLVCTLRKQFPDACRLSCGDLARVWVRQGGRCAITGLPMTWTDAGTWQPLPASAADEDGSATTSQPCHDDCDSDWNAAKKHNKMESRGGVGGGARVGMQWYKPPTYVSVDVKNAYRFMTSGTTPAAVDTTNTNTKRTRNGKPKSRGGGSARVMVISDDVRRDFVDNVRLVAFVAHGFKSNFGDAEIIKFLRETKEYVTTGKLPTAPASCAPPDPVRVRSQLARCLANSARRAATRSKLMSMDTPHNITLVDLQEVYERQGGRCAISGATMYPAFHSPNRPIEPRTISIDRIDSSRGYTRDNIQLLAFSINIAKSSYDNDMFIDLLRRMEVSDI